MQGPPVDPTYGCTYAPAQRVVRTGLPGATLPGLPAPAPAPPPATLPPGISPEQILWPYLIYELDTEYHWLNGILPIPVSPPDDTVPSGPKSTPDIGGEIAIGDGGSQILKTWGDETSNQLQKPLSPQYGDTPPSTGSLINDISDRVPCVQIPVTAPIGYRVVTFFAVRIGTQPDLPNPTPPSDNEALLTARHKFKALKWLADGQMPVYVAAGIYVYSLLRPYWGSDGLVVPSSPSDNSTLESNFYAPSGFDPELA